MNNNFEFKTRHVSIDLDHLQLQVLQLRFEITILKITSDAN